MWVPRGSATQVVLFSLWLLIAVIGFQKLFIYSNTPGIPAAAPSDWPSKSKLQRDPAFASLVIFAHPRCPCSAATLGELERLIPHTKGKVKNFVVFVIPSGLAKDWAKENLWKTSETIPETQTLLDDGGYEAAKFGAKTSGQVFLYDSHGHLAFQGGITPARGHMGDNDGRAAILAFGETGKTGISKSSVFGCALMNPERATAEVTR